MFILKTVYGYQGKYTDYIADIERMSLGSFPHFPKTTHEIGQASSVEEAGNPSFEASAYINGECTGIKSWDHSIEVYLCDNKGDTINVLRRLPPKSSV